MYGLAYWNTCLRSSSESVGLWLTNGHCCWGIGMHAPPLFFLLRVSDWRPTSDWSCICACPTASTSLQALPLSMNCTASCCCCCFPSNCHCPLWTMKVDQLFSLKIKVSKGCSRLQGTNHCPAAIVKVSISKKCCFSLANWNSTDVQVTKISMNMKGKFCQKMKEVIHRSTLEFLRILTKIRQICSFLSFPPFSLF